MKIATLNLCLGLKFKKLLIEQILNTNEVKILCLQEVDIESSFDHRPLNINGY